MDDYPCPLCGDTTCTIPGHVIYASKKRIKDRELFDDYTKDGIALLLIVFFIPIWWCLAKLLELILN